MESFLGLALSELPIPYWQIVLYIAFLSFLSLTDRWRSALLLSYLLTLYWAFYLFRDPLVAAARGDLVALSAYIFFGFALAGLAVYTFFYLSPVKRERGMASFEIGKLQKSLLKRIEQMELAVINAETKAVQDIQKLEELRQQIEGRVASLENRLQNVQGGLGRSESAIREAEANLASQIHDLEARLKEKEGLLGEREREIKHIRLELETQVSRLQAELREREEAVGRSEGAIRQRESAIKELEEKLVEREAQIRELREEKQNLSEAVAAQATADLERKIEELEVELKEKTALIQRLQAPAGTAAFGTEAKILALEAEVQEREDALKRKEASFKEVVQALFSRIEELERQLRDSGEAEPGSDIQERVRRMLESLEPAEASSPAEEPEPGKREPSFMPYSTEKGD